ncbi:hypothetical protein NKE60_09295 [Streptococcus suis]|uniref:hypothetical protein n=1 Tax=Streptococcus suis TaxID=1307 RepID=UPI00209A8A72|nr:hypothetical protein [Streptococcus suis]MCO8184899.1 hypothetical protein [Streptococcus suis]MCO8216465.1 hypothetical protein [Streptococcus suis]HEM3496688.1 hypothetical protein [Streptococcus suis]HEM3509872.1 hypothetical protein [Streptococcus suis]
MKYIKIIFEGFKSFTWYNQLVIALASTFVVVLLIKFLIWIVPIIGAILALIIIFTEGEIFSTIWESYKQRKHAPTNPLFTTVYHRLTEHCVTDLPVSTLQFTQGVEFPDFKQGVYFVHLEKDISNEALADFETKVRQTVKFMSNGHTDCIVSKARREPFLAIKVRLIPAHEVGRQQQMEEDF